MPERRFLRATISLGLVLWLALLVAANGAAVSAKDLTANPAKFDGQTVTLRGTAQAVKATTSRKGNDYTTFQVKDGSGAAIKVFSWGHPEIQNGSTVEIVGVFQQVKPVGRYTFYNEVEAETVRPLGR